MKNSAIPVARMSETSAGNREVIEGESTGVCHAVRNGPVSASMPPTMRSRWVGLTSAARLTSTPKAWCHTRSPTPPMPKSTRPTMLVR